MIIKRPKAFETRPACVLLDLDNTLYAYKVCNSAGMDAARALAQQTLNLAPADFDACFASARTELKARLGATAASHSRLLYFQRTIERAGFGSQPFVVLQLEQAFWRAYLGAARLHAGVLDFLDDLRIAGVPSVIVTDLTERRQSENALRRISDELLEKNGQLETFSYSISHDMRAPLRTMQGFGKILLEECGDKLEPGPKSDLDRIVSSAEHLDRLILDVLAYSRLSRDQHELATFDLGKMVRDMVDTYPNLRAANIEVAASSAKVRGYKVALDQCISNLLGNAIKFVPAGVAPCIKVWIQTDNGRVRLWIQDNGIGILPKDQQRIFAIFSRLHSNEDYEGTGIGLSMVKKAVEKMGGRVGVESELGQGSRFWIELKKA